MTANEIRETTKTFRAVVRVGPFLFELPRGARLLDAGGSIGVVAWAFEGSRRRIESEAAERAHGKNGEPRPGDATRPPGADGGSP